MTDHASTLYPDLPDGYRLRLTRPVARSTRDRWNDRWDYDLRDLYVRGGFSWMRAGYGHTGSGILRALESRQMVEVAESKSGPLLVRLTNEGHRIGEAVAVEIAERNDVEPPTPPADAEIVYRPIPAHKRPGRPTSQRFTPTVLDESEAHLLVVLRDELRAIEESLARFAEYERQDEIADYEMRDRLALRVPELRRQISTLAGRAV